MEARYDEMANSGVAPEDIAAGLTADAEAISAEATLANARIGRSAADTLTAPAAGDRAADEAYAVLMHGDAGPLSCGMVGIATTCFRSIIDRGLRLHVWVTEAAPSGEGSRVAAYQLAQADIPHDVVPDSAVAWVFGSHTIDSVLLRADTVLGDGSALALLGARQVARLAADAGVPVFALAPRSALDADGFVRVLETAAPPLTEVVPVELIGAWISETGTR
jgi:methylthioribose-1-phosphate isomerase